MNVEFNRKIMEELMEELKDKRPVLTLKTISSFHWHG